MQAHNQPEHNHIKSIGNSTGLRIFVNLTAIANKKGYPNSPV